MESREGGFRVLWGRGTTHGPVALGPMGSGEGAGPRRAGLGPPPAGAGGLQGARGRNCTGLGGARGPGAGLAAP